MNNGGMPFSLIISCFMLFFVMDSLIGDDPLQMTCIENPNKYCKDKFFGFWFIDGCTNCVCTSKGGRCAKGSCKYTVKNDNDAFDYCEKVMAKNKKLFTIGLKLRKNRQKHNKLKVRKNNKNHHKIHKFNPQLKFKKRQHQIKKHKISNRKRKLRKYSRQNRIKKILKRNRMKKNLKHKPKRYTRKRDNKKLKIIRYIRNKSRQINKTKKRLNKWRKGSHIKKHLYKRKQRKHKKKRVFNKKSLIFLLKKIVTKHNKSIKYLKRMVLRNYNLIQMLKLRLLKMSRYNGLLIVLQREVADLMIMNEKMQLKIKWMKSNSKLQKRVKKFHSGNSRRLKKRFSKLFKNKKRRKIFMQKLKKLNNGRKKFSKDLNYYYNRINGSV